MEIKLELIKKDIAEFVERNIENLEIDVEEIAQTKAMVILSQIKAVICNTELNDFLMVDEIIEIFYKHGIDTGAAHDFV